MQFYLNPKLATRKSERSSKIGKLCKATNCSLVIYKYINFVFPKLNITKVICGCIKNFAN